jgi:hypothetical protein
MDTILGIMGGLETFQCSVKDMVHRKGNLVDVETVSRNMVKCGFLLVLDQFFEITDFLGIQDLNGEAVARIIAEN